MATVHDEGTSHPQKCPTCGVGPEFFEEQKQPGEKVERDGIRVVIIGAGGAGFGAAEGARREAPRARIVLINGEPGLPYLRMDLTRYLAGQVQADELPLRDEKWYREQDIELIHGRVTQIEALAQELVIDSGEVIDYDRLIIATGAVPVMPPFEGSQLQGVHTLRTLEDCDALLAALDEGHGRRSLTLIGGGLLGLEMAGALRRRGALVRVIELAPYLLPRQLAEPAAKRLERYLSELGIEILCGQKVHQFLGNTTVTDVQLEQGKKLPTDQVVVAVGVRPCNRLAMEAGLDTARGLLVDDHLRTNDAKIFAAGDICEHRSVVQGLWTIAYEQGLIAGANAAGAQQTYSPKAAATKLKVLDLPTFSVGSPTMDEKTQRFIHEDEELTAVLNFKDNLLVGANLMGELELADELSDAALNAYRPDAFEKTAARCPDFGAWAKQKLKPSS